MKKFIRGDKVVLYGYINGIVIKDMEDEDTNVKITKPTKYNTFEEDKYADYFNANDVEYDFAR